jgi:Domain of unknown function (DUF4383)
MNAPVIARGLGVLFLAAGIAGFLPWIAPAAPMDAPVVSMDMMYRMLFGIFPVNVAHNALHLLFGLWGLAAGGSFKSGVFYCRAVMWIYFILVICGIIPIMNTLFGVAPIYGWDIGLHFVTVLLGAYGGYGRGSQEADVEPT